LYQYSMFEKSCRCTVYNDVTTQSISKEKNLVTDC